MPSEWSSYFLGGIVLTVAMAAVWLARIKAKGKRAIVMAAAFLSFAGLLQSLRLELPAAYIWVLGAAVAVLLATDIVMRLSEEPRQK